MMGNRLRLTGRGFPLFLLLAVFLISSVQVPGSTAAEDASGGGTVLSGVAVQISPYGTDVPLNASVQVITWRPTYVGNLVLTPANAVVYREEHNCYLASLNVTFNFAEPLKPNTTYTAAVFVMNDTVTWNFTTTAQAQNGPVQMPRVNISDLVPDGIQLNQSEINRAWPNLPSAQELLAECHNGQLGLDIAYSCDGSVHSAIIHYVGNYSATATIIEAGLVVQNVPYIWLQYNNSLWVQVPYTYLETTVEPYASAVNQLLNVRLPGFPWQSPSSDSSLAVDGGSVFSPYFGTLVYSAVALTVAFVAVAGLLAFKAKRKDALHEATSSGSPPAA